MHDCLSRSDLKAHTVTPLFSRCSVQIKVSYGRYTDTASTMRRWLTWAVGALVLHHAASITIVGTSARNNTVIPARWNHPLTVTRPTTRELGMTFNLTNHVFDCHCPGARDRRRCEPRNHAYKRHRDCLLLDAVHSRPRSPFYHFTPGTHTEHASSCCGVRPLEGRQKGGLIGRVTIEDVRLPIRSLAHSSCSGRPPSGEQLPAGLSLNTATGAITGTPFTGCTPGGSACQALFNITVRNIRLR